MCGRYFFDDKTAYEVEDELNLSKGAISTGAGDIMPGMSTSGIIWEKGGAGGIHGGAEWSTSGADENKSGTDVALSDLFWGIESKDKKLIINARAESVAEKSMFADSIRNRRCILPAAGFYEWDASKTKFMFKRADKRPIYLAGFYDLSRNRDSFVILTTSANASMKPVHDRMPVMIDKGNVREYLKDSAAAMEMLREPMPELDRSSDYEQLSLF